jgi:nucleoside-diphosphate-sugar epimerase
MGKVLVAGAGGFIGGHLVERLLREGKEVVAVDVKPLDEWYQYTKESERLSLVDLSTDEGADFVTKYIDEVYMLAADMGGMGYIESHKVNCMLSVLISANMMRYSIKHGVKKYLYSSSACVYPSYKQLEEEVSLRESDAYPADPEPGYGLEKLFSEELAINVGRENSNIKTYVPRFHNIFGELGTYDGGREKAPAAICRKVIEAKLSGNHSIEIWGDGEQTRSFMHVDDCVEGMLRLMGSDFHDPINLGSDRLVSINDLVTMVEEIAGIKVERRYDLTKPQGVRGRCSNNDLVKEVLGWEPEISLEDGLERTYKWIYKKMTHNGSGTR